MQSRNLNRSISARINNNNTNLDDEDAGRQIRKALRVVSISHDQMPSLHWSSF